MKKLYFENSRNKKILLGYADEENVMEAIRDFCAANGYQIPYVRSWEDDEGIRYDVGSHTEFFLLSDLIFIDAYRSVEY